MNKQAEEMLRKLDDGEPADENGGFLGIDFPVKDAALVMIPVPWDATTSYGKGTADGPGAIIEASHQLDVFDLAFGKPFRSGITMLAESEEIRRLNNECAKTVETARGDDEKAAKAAVAKVNKASARVNELVYEEALKQHKAGKLVGVVGGDHSSPYGLLKMFNDELEGNFGILHFDAHYDLRDAYEGFEHSHASIMHNALRDFSKLERLVHIGIRDFSVRELDHAKSQGGRVRTYFARDLFNLSAQGISFHDVATQIVNELPENVYISFDIDGLDPVFCPSTGTPVAGGLSYQEALYILETLAESGRKIIGFDLCEVAPAPSGEDEWDANVGARMLYKLCGATLRSQKKC